MNAYIEILLTSWINYILLGATFLLYSKAGFTNLGLGGILIFSGICFSSVLAWSNSIWLAVSLTMILAFIIWCGLAVVVFFCEVNDILATLFFQYAAISLGLVWLGIVRDKNENILATKTISEVYWLNNIGNSILGYGILTFFLISICWVIFARTETGYIMRVASSNLHALNKKYRLKVIVVLSFICSAIIASFVAFNICSKTHRYTENLYNTIGFSALIVGIVALSLEHLLKNSRLSQKIALPIAALLLAAFDIISAMIKQEFGLGAEATNIMLAVALGYGAWTMRNRTITQK